MLYTVQALLDEMIIMNQWTIIVWYLNFLGSPMVDGQIGFCLRGILNLVRRVSRRSLRPEHSSVVCQAKQANMSNGISYACGDA